MKPDTAKSSGDIVRGSCSVLSPHHGKNECQKPNKSLQRETFLSCQLETWIHDNTSLSFKSMETGPRGLLLSRAPKLAGVGPRAMCDPAADPLPNSEVCSVQETTLTPGNATLIHVQVFGIRGEY